MSIKSCPFMFAAQEGLGDQYQCIGHEVNCICFEWKNPATKAFKEFANNEKKSIDITAMAELPYGFCNHFNHRTGHEERQ